ncbi:MAG: hemerythrin domain-containing protein [Bdellovibrionota bacterium]
MTILEVLKNDHDRIKALLERLINNIDSAPEKRSDLIARIRDEVIPHARAEEAVLYNSMRKADGPTDMVYHGFKEHAETEAMLYALETMDTLHVDFKALAQKLHDSLVHHVEEEETDLFPQFKEIFSMSESELMAEEFNELKPKIREQNALKSSIDLVGNLISPAVSQLLKDKAPLLSKIESKLRPSV